VLGSELAVDESKHYSTGLALVVNWLVGWVVEWLGLLPHLTDALSM